MQRNVARTRDTDTQPAQISSDFIQHVFEKQHHPIARGLGPDKTATKLQSLSCQDTLERPGNPLVLSEHVANLSGADADVAGGHIEVGADVAIQFIDE